MRVSGDTILTEGVVYPFTLEIAKKMALAPRRPDAAPLILQEAVPTFGDSARACLEGAGFHIELAGEQGRGTCRVTTLKDSAQRIWTWNVRPDTVSRVHGQQRAERRLLFTVKSYPEGTRADFERSYPVTVRIIPLTWWERVMNFVTSTQGLVVSLAAIATALATIYGYLRRKPGEGGAKD
ncbi:MAG: hypothetical protein H3C62_06450 [Gemmatimonadaceae bacterium]|nr:hypothetical protein [Gemmatimonadaceae bacterium]